MSQEVREIVEPGYSLRPQISGPEATRGTQSSMHAVKHVEEPGLGTRNEASKVAKPGLGISTHGAEPYETGMGVHVAENIKSSASVTRGVSSEAINPEEANMGPRRSGPVPCWCPRGLTKTQRCRLQKMRQRELAEKRMEANWDAWFA
jgi:hypothetical protein